MSLLNLIFYGLILMTAGAALFMIITSNVLHAALGLIVCLLGMAGIFAVMGAEFLAVTQIMVYAGGVIVLIIFGIMLTNRTFIQKQSINRYVFPGLTVAFGFFILLSLLFSENEITRRVVIQHQPDHVQQLGVMLLTEYTAPFEVSGLLLLICLIAAAFAATAHQKK